MENKIIYSKTIVKLKEKQSLKMFNLKKKKKISVKRDLIILKLSTQYLLLV